MPNRIIKESIRESYRINSLTQSAEILFYRLITYADDFGIFKSDTRLLNKAMFPLKNYNTEQISECMNQLSNAGLITLYLAPDNKPYGYFLSWTKHQTKRNTKSKYPIFDDKCKLFESINELMDAVEINCNQLKN